MEASRTAHIKDVLGGRMGLVVDLESPCRACSGFRQGGPGC